MLMVETADTREPLGIDRYTLLPRIEAGMPFPEIGFVIANKSVRGKGYGKEATALLTN
jgi:RimJ/RimL family protein N-acetyltransferase